ncbi:cyclic nucleotide-binding domain-containing protein [Chitinophaga sp. LS1]|uniref:cyclic nucleotide-binding domain-containing protein n=1 Tax=Chitinophaga sp. LS1 TaxID=3051176 RepID=UPI002AAC199F|nr:cyclic nucleotide-binding domain-containing protein [Chitinophaga sp. LS1]WPV70326.1 cyclic nucleotide-binding domain-containing protein [Chitinophaga sp. LS1]
MPTILVIDDNKTNNENLVEILEFAGYNVIVSEHGRQGLLVAETSQPDLILCDLSFSILDGFVVLQMLSRNQFCCRIPFVFLTSRTEREDIRIGMDLGADDYITRPFDPSELLSSIECQIRKGNSTGLSGLNGLNKIVQEITTPPVESDFPLKVLARDRVVNFFKKKQVIYHQGGYPSCLYFILKGKVKTYILDEDGKEFITDLYVEGDFFGYASLLYQKRYVETAEAIMDVEVSVIPRNEFEGILSEDSSFRKQIMKLLAQDINEREKQLLKSAYDSLRKKTADALLILYGKYNQSGQCQVGIKFTRSNLAALVGVAKESMARTLAEFKDEHLIDVRNGAIFILDMDKMIRMCR